MFVLTVFVTRSDTVYFHVLKCHHSIVQICVLLILEYKTWVCTFAGLETSSKEICEAPLFGIWHSDIVCCDPGKCSDRRIYRISAK